MSIFTKIFVVLVMLMAVLLAALIVPFVVNSTNYRDQWQTVQAALDVQKYNAAQHESDLSKQIDTLNATIKAQTDQTNALTAQLNGMQTQNQNLQAQVIQLQNANNDVRGQLARLSTGLDQATQINSMLQSEIKDRRSKMLEEQNHNTELTLALRDKTTQSDTLVQQVRLLKEKVADLSSQNDKLTDKLESLQTVAAAQKNMSQGLQDIASGTTPSVAIHGMVTDVKKIGDETFVALNIGSNDKVKPGMKFMVHKGDAYLGDVVITQVDLNSSAGRVVLKHGDITTNAEVLAGGGL